MDQEYKRHLFEKGFDTLYDFCLGKSPADDPLNSDNPLENVCKDEEFTIVTDKEGVHSRIDVIRHPLIYHELKTVRDLALSTEYNGAQLDSSERQLLEEAKQILILTDVQDYSLGLTEDPNNMLEARLIEYKTPIIFVDMWEFGNAFRKHINTGSMLYKVSPNQFEETLKEMAASIYSTVELMHSDYDFEGTSEDSAERRLNFFDLAIRTFTEAVPSYAVTIFGLDGQPIIDELDTEVSGTHVCLKKETDTVSRMISNNIRGLKSRYKKLFPYSQKSSSEAKKLGEYIFISKLVETLKNTE